MAPVTRGVCIVQHNDYTASIVTPADNVDLSELGAAVRTIMRGK